jgi:glycosyltransferase involved in cell wall biosynthesis
MPSVSVIIPTYNRKKLLTRAIESVMSQQYTDYELIVVDDASGDSTEQLDFFDSRKYPSITYFRLDSHRGVSAARNFGVRMASGKWIAFLDSDDQWHPQKLKRQMEWIGRYPATVILQTKEVWIRGGRRVNPPATHRKREGYIFTESLKRCMITPSSVCITRAAFDTTGGFNEALPACEDYDLWLRITHTVPVGLIDEYLLTRYGGHPDQLSSTVWALDRFRIRSLLDIIRSGVLTPVQRQEAIREVRRKALIVANGYKKRGNYEKHEQYAHIASTYENESIAE